MPAMPETVAEKYIKRYIPASSEHIAQSFFTFQNPELQMVSSAQLIHVCTQNIGGLRVIH